MPIISFLYSALLFVLFLLISNIPCFAICCVEDSVKVKRHRILYPEVLFMNGQGEARIDFS